MLVLSKLNILWNSVNYITCLAWALVGLPGVWGIWGEWIFNFRELRSTGNYFRGTGEQAHSLRDLESPAKQQNK